MEFVERPVCEVEIPLTSDLHQLRVENSILKFARGLSLDIGSWCYLRRSSDARKRGRGTLVDLASFDPVRASQVRALICQASDSRLCGLRPTSVHSTFTRLRRFIDWCDSNGHIYVLRDIESARAALREHTSVIRRLVDQHQAANNTEAMNQYLIIKVIEEYFCTDELTVGINLLADIPELKTSTPVPGDDDQAKALSIAQTIFDGFSHLVVDRESDGGAIQLPIFLKLPALITDSGRGIWVFPLKCWNAKSRTDLKRDGAYDFQTGRIRTIDEMSHLFPERCRGENKVAVLRARANIRASNEESHHWFRLQSGMLAMSAFYLMFMAVTGQNQAQVLEIPWSEELQRNLQSPSMERQGFRQIKYRAQGRIVSFEVGVRFMPQLRRYLQLRHFLLMGHSCDLLFFRYSGPERVDSSSLVLPAVAPLSRFYRSLKNLASDIPSVLTRQWRAAKDNHVIRRTGDPVLSAGMAQHGLATSLKSYNNGDEVTHQQEMGSYLVQMESHVLTTKSESSKNEPRALGQCTSPGMPTPTIPEAPIQVDCERAEGCLFCDKFRVHADEEDVRKLLSARHCIRHAGHYCQSVEEHAFVMGPILRRIDFVLAEIRVVNEDLVSRTEIEVDVHGELHPFWSAKLETLTALGMELV